MPFILLWIVDILFDNLMFGDKKASLFFIIIMIIFVILLFIILLNI